MENPKGHKYEKFRILQDEEFLRLFAQYQESLKQEIADRSYEARDGFVEKYNPTVERMIVNAAKKYGIVNPSEVKTIYQTLSFEIIDYVLTRFDLKKSGKDGKNIENSFRLALLGMTGKMLSNYLRTIESDRFRKLTYLRTMKIVREHVPSDLTFHEVIAEIKGMSDDRYRRLLNNLPFKNKQLSREELIVRLTLVEQKARKTVISLDEPLRGKKKEDTEKTLQAVLSSDWEGGITRDELKQLIRGYFTDRYPLIRLGGVGDANKKKYKRVFYYYLVQTLNKGKEPSNAEVSKRFKLSPERIRQILLVIKRSLAKYLKEHLES